MKALDLRTWTEAQLAGQRIMAGFDGTRFDSALEQQIAGLRLGGLILFRRNIASPGQITTLCRSAQDCARRQGLPPLLIAIDQEGGQVARLGPPFTQFPGNPAMTGEEDALGFAATTASELASIGVNMNLAPVIDVAPEGFPSVMAGRIFGTDPHWVARLGGAVIDGLQSRRIMAVAKHFPGIGRTSLDSHLDRPVFEDTLESLEGFDLIPFRDAARRRVSGVMLSHIVYRRIDPQWPASLSRRIAADLLRKRLGYRGVVLTDDLEMGAITRYYDLDTAVRRIFRADIDIALICRSPELQAQAFEILVGLGGSSERARRGSERSVWRILRLKADYLQ